MPVWLCILDISVNTTCKPPKDGQNTVPVPADGKWFIGEVYEYQCKNGWEPYYPFKDDMKVTCTPELTWSPQTSPTCTSK